MALEPVDYGLVARVPLETWMEFTESVVRPWVPQRAFLAAVEQSAPQSALELTTLRSWRDDWTGLDPVAFGPPVARFYCARCAADGHRVEIRSSAGAWFHLSDASGGHHARPA